MAKAQRPTSWYATEDDRAKLRKLQGRLLMQGGEISQSDVIKIALNVLGNMSDEELAAAYDSFKDSCVDDGE